MPSSIALLAHVPIKTQQLRTGQLLGSHDFLNKKSIEMTTITLLFLLLHPIAEHFVTETNTRK
jgi:hypothetical protein